MAAICVACAHGAEWKYPESAANGWGELCSSGPTQSPIDIDPSSVEVDLSMPALRPSYQSSANVKVVHNGHALQVSATDRGNTLMADGTNYVLAQLHFHSGRDGGEGSEHVIGGKAFPLEGHFVHYDAKYENLTDGLTSDRGHGTLLVVGVFFMEGDEENEIMQPMVELFSSISAAGESQDKSGFNWQALLSEKLTRFYYTYNGSLTTPGCHEFVHWFVSKKIVKISSAQMKVFRDQLYQNGAGDTYNYRTPQPLKGRTVKTNLEYAQLPGFTGVVGMDCPGGDIGGWQEACSRSPNTTLDECAARCLTNGMCGGFVLWTPPNADAWCCIKQGRCEMKNLVVRDSTYSYYRKVPYKLHGGADCLGHDIKCKTHSAEKKVLSLKMCEMACSSRRQCLGFEYVGGAGLGGRNWCCLKKKRCMPNELINTGNTDFSYYERPRGSLTRNAADMQLPGYVNYPKADCAGNDIGGWENGCTRADIIDLKTCGQRCENNTECQGFEYITGGYAGAENWCCIKNKACEKSQLSESDEKFNFYAKAAAVTPYAPKMGVDCIGHDIGGWQNGCTRTMNMTQGECLDMCTAEPKCKSVQYVIAGGVSGGQVWCCLKEAVCESPSPATPMYIYYVRAESAATDAPNGGGGGGAAATQGIAAATEAP